MISRKLRGVGALIAAAVSASLLVLASQTTAAASDAWGDGTQSIPAPGFGRLVAEAAHSSPQKGTAITWPFAAAAAWNANMVLRKDQTYRLTVTYYASASLRTGASLSIGVGPKSGSAGWSSSWQNIKTASSEAYVMKPGKQVIAYGSAVVTPGKDYRSNTFAVIATATFTCSWDTSRQYTVSAAA